MKGLVALFLVLAASTLLYFFLFSYDEPPSTPVNGGESTNVAVDDVALTVFTEIKPDRWFASTPENNAVVPSVPREVIVRFQAPVDASSSIVVKHNATVVSDGDAKLTQDSQSLYVPIKDSEGPGPYLVTYKACTGKDECAAGRFGFNVR